MRHLLPSRQHFCYYNASSAAESWILIHGDGDELLSRSKETCYCADEVLSW